MGSRKPSRAEIVEAEFPVALTVAVDPLHHELVRRALVRTVGADNYATTTKAVWSATKVWRLHFRNLLDAERFILACPQARLHGEPYTGPRR
jgi:hypothetical protein